MRLMLVLCLALLAVGSPAAHAANFPAANPADQLLAAPIESYRYDHAVRCGKQPRAGTVALQHWLSAHVEGVFWGIMRCEKWGPRSASLHAEGRAIDWHLDVADPASRREAYRLIDLLLAADRNGNAHALARRMGVQEIIYDCKSWWSGQDRLGRYSYCYSKRTGKRKKKVDRTAAHLDHIHLGLNRMGASKQTSFWHARR